MVVITRKLAQQGMKGRKRDTLLLRTVITLSFVFITLATIFISSIKHTENYQKEQLYATWQTSILGATQGEIDYVKSHFNDDEYAVSELLGTYDGVGTVGTIDDNLIGMGSFKLLEGDFPKSRNDILIESNQLGALGASVDVGDTITVEVKYQVGSISEDEKQTFKAKIKSNNADTLSSLSPDERESFVGKMFDSTTSCYYKGRGYVTTQFKQNGTPLSQSERLFEYLYYRSLYFDFEFNGESLGWDSNEAIKEITAYDPTLYTYEGMTVKLFTEYYYAYSQDDYNFEGSGVQLQKDIRDKGVVMNQYVVARLDFNVCGIIETYTDRWDTGFSTLANSFVCESGADFIKCAVEAATEGFKFGDANTKFNCPSNVFIKSKSLTPVEAYCVCVDASESSEKSVNETYDEFLANQTYREVMLYGKPCLISDKNYDESCMVEPQTVYAPINGYAIFVWDVPEYTDAAGNHHASEEVNVLVPKDVFDMFVEEFVLEADERTAEINDVLGGSFVSAASQYRILDTLKKFDVFKKYMPYGDFRKDTENWVEIWDSGTKYVLNRKYFNENGVIEAPATYNYDSSMNPVTIIDKDGKETMYLVNDSEFDIYYFYLNAKLQGDDEAADLDASDREYYASLRQSPYDNTNTHLRINSLAYPEDVVDTQATLTITVVGIIFITTACAVFQIFLTQIKRRTRKIALLKAVGATNGQIGGMLVWEGVYLLAVGLPLGAVIGFIVSYAAIFISNDVQANKSIIFSVDPASLALGLVFGILALFLGMLIPMIIAIRTPLRGSMSGVGVKKTSVKRRAVSESALTTRQTFASVSKRHAQSNRSKNTVSFALSTFIISIMLIALFLGFCAFDDYKKIVLNDNRPDFLISAPYGMAPRFVEDKVPEIGEVAGISDVYAYRVIEKVPMMHEAFSPLTEHDKRSNIIYAFRQTAGIDRLDFFTQTQDLDSGSEDSSEDEDDNNNTQLVEGTDIVISSYDKQNMLQLTAEQLARFIIPNSSVSQSMAHITNYRAYYGYGDDYFDPSQFIDPSNPDAGDSDPQPDDVNDNPDAASEDDETFTPLLTTIYGIDADYPVMEQLKAAFAQSDFDEKEFAEGNQVILLVPKFLKGTSDDYTSVVEGDFSKVSHAKRMSAILDAAKAFKLSYDKRFATYYDTEDVIKVGDRLEFEGSSISVGDETTSDKTIKKTATVGAIINYFPNDSIWPFSDNCMGYEVIAGNNLVTKLRPGSSRRLNAEEVQGYLMMDDLFYGGINGHTDFYIYGSDEMTRADTDLPLLTYAKSLGLSLTNYRESNSALYNEAVNNAMIIALLGIAAAMIALVILSNTVSSSVEQDSKRYGILQSIGVEARSFKLEQYRTGFLNGLISILIANALVALILFFTTFGATFGYEMSIGDYFADMIQNRLAMYPWALHAALCIVYLAIQMVIYRAPLKTVLKRSPIENIRA
jgi:ABC-type antimicrobial peptide transport system permease subunit